jgi:competence protein ComEA
MERSGARALLAVAAALFLAALPRPAPRRPAAPRPLPGGAAGLLFGRPLDANRAPPELLEVLPGIGSGRARAIARARARRPFCRVEDLTRVRGIGPVTLSRLRTWVRIAAPTSCASRPDGPN